MTHPDTVKTLKHQALLVLIFLIVFTLSACSTNQAPSLEIEATGATGFEFQVDPQSETVTP